MDDTFTTLFGDHLQRWLDDEPGRRRADFARAVGVDPSQVTRWAAKDDGGRPDPRTTLPALCKVLGLSVTESRALYVACGVPLEAVLMTRTT